MTVLVLGGEFDPTIDHVVTELGRRDVEVFRADTAWFPQTMTLGAELEDGGWTGTLTTAQRRLDLGRVRSVWYRRPTEFILPAGLSEPEHRHALMEAKLGVGGVLADLPVLWVNRPRSDAAASYKPVQLFVAQRCGLAVPPTLITNRPDDVRAFAARHQHVVVKPLGFGSVFEDDAALALYTHVLTTADLSDLSGIATTAHLLQRFVGPKAFEARVTVVGEQMFAAAIRAGSPAAQVDWRSDYAALSYDIIEIPAPVADGLRALLRHLDLTFGAADFVIDTEGSWWFLEVNSGGQWGFVEHATGLPITAALANLLEKGAL